MSQKINPISFRLGLLQIWNVTTTTYGNNINFFQTSTKNKVKSYINSFLKNCNLQLGTIYWAIFPKKISLIITHVNLTNNFKNVKSLTKCLSEHVSFLFDLPVKIYFLKHSSWFCSSEFIKAYIEFCLDKNMFFKQILKNILKIINTQLGSKKVVYTSNGPLLLKLGGFKIRSSGRLLSSRSQMSQTTKTCLGSTSLSKLNKYVEYTQGQIYTKSGVCSLHIWLIYTP